MRKTILLVTHDPKAAERAERILHLEKGQLVGTTTGAGASAYRAASSEKDGDTKPIGSVSSAERLARK